MPGNFLSPHSVPGTCWAITGGAILVVFSDPRPGLIMVPVFVSSFWGICKPSIRYVDSCLIEESYPEESYPKEYLSSTLHLWDYLGLRGQAHIPEEFSGKLITTTHNHGIFFMGLCEIGPQK